MQVCLTFLILGCDLSDLEFDLSDIEFDLSYFDFNLCELDSVQRFCYKFLEREKHIIILINNAG